MLKGGVPDSGHRNGFSIAILMAAAIPALGCTQKEPIDFDPMNDWHCSLSFRETAVAASEGGGEELAKSMIFRAEWAEREAEKAGLAQPTSGQKATLQEFLESTARAGAESAIACRHRQNLDPEFPKNTIL